MVPMMIVVVVMAMAVLVLVLVLVFLLFMTVSMRMIVGVSMIVVMRGLIFLVLLDFMAVRVIVIVIVVVIVIVILVVAVVVIVVVVVVVIMTMTMVVIVRVAMVLVPVAAVGVVSVFDIVIMRFLYLDRHVLHNGIENISERGQNATAIGRVFYLDDHGADKHARSVSPEVNVLLLDVGNAIDQERIAERLVKEIFHALGDRLQQDAASGNANGERAHQ